VDRNDVLNYYTIESSKGKGYAIIAAKEKIETFLSRFLHKYQMGLRI
jgi:hypothetical protein